MTTQFGSGTASGKVILFGEHAVVYGVPAISAGISKGVKAVAKNSDKCSLRINGTLLASDHELYAALNALRSTLDAPPVSIELTLEIPAGSGLGASAAMGVASARSIISLFEKEQATSHRHLFDAAQAWERIFHGNPSGVDVASTARSGVLCYVRGEEPTPLLLKRPLTLVIAQAGPPASTKKMVENVAKFQTRNPSQFDRNLQAIASLVENGKLLLRQGDLNAVGKLMDLNQMLLASWMLSTEKIETACRLAREAGALGAKLTGAGGGGCVVALADSHPSANPIVQSWEKAKIPCFSASVGEVPNEAAKSGES